MAEIIHLQVILLNYEKILNSLIFIFVVFIISYIFAEQIYNFLVEPYANAVKR